jgi:glutamate-1-semialdehyde 2,1-aminomutase
MPCAAYGGREDVMRKVAPDGPVYQAGTLSGNPLAMAAGLATLKQLQQPGVYEQLEQTTTRLATGLREAAKTAGVSMVVNQVGSMITPFFTDADEVRDYRDATAGDTQRFAAFFGAMLDAGVVLPPSQFEAWFVGTMHDDAAIDETIKAARRALK